VGSRYLFLGSKGLLRGDTNRERERERRDNLRHYMFARILDGEVEDKSSVFSFL
ncbi:unnamed protein product, partial [Musa textilis]